MTIHEFEQLKKRIDRIERILIAIYDALPNFIRNGLAETKVDDKFTIHELFKKMHRGEIE